MKIYQLIFLIGFCIGPLIIIVGYIQFSMAYKNIHSKSQSQQAKKLLVSYIQNSNKQYKIRLIGGGKSKFLFVVKYHNLRQYYYVFIDNQQVKAEDVGFTTVYDLATLLFHRPIVKLSTLPLKILQNIYSLLLVLLLLSCLLTIYWFFFGYPHWLLDLHQ